MTAGRMVIMTMTVVTDSENMEMVAKTTEAFSRVAAGLVLDGIGSNLTLAEVDTDIEVDDDIAVGGSDD